jgi:ribosomal protein S18 acetylase RimI-like enzyme
MAAFRSGPRSADREAIRRLVKAARVFSEIEVGWAVEVVDAALDRGKSAGYHFLFADGEAGLDGFTCFGPIDGTDNRFDLYWIAVSPETQSKGLGRRLMLASMDAARASGGTHMFVDTSSRLDYVRAHALYETLGFKRMAMLEDFYADGDSKLIFGRKL